MKWVNEIRKVFVPQISFGHSSLNKWEHGTVVDQA